MDRLPLVELDAKAPGSLGAQRTFAARKARRWGKSHFGFTLIEVMLAVTIAGILITLIVTMYQSYRERIDVNRAGGGIAAGLADHME